MYDAIIVGAGPAGISASLYIKRANLKVLVLYYGESELEKAHKIDNYYGFKNGITGKDLYEAGVEQAKNLGIEVRKEEIINIEMTDDLKFVVKTTERDYDGKTVIIATGNKKERPNIKGIEDFEGKGISYCAICDGFFYRGKNVVVIGDGNYAIHEANDLAGIAENIKILTNGNGKPNTDRFEIDDRKIKQIHGEKKVSSIEFEDGKFLNIDGIFIAQGIAGGNDFAKKLGIILNKNNIVVNENMETNVKGIFACGNVTGGLLQVNKAVYEGAKAGLQAVQFIRNIK